MKKIFILLPLSFGLFFHSTELLSKQKEQKRSWLKPFSRQKKKKPYRMHIDGVECKVCAHTVVSKLGRLKTIESPEFLLINNDFAKSYATVQALPEDFVILDVQKAIKSRESEYIIDAVHGEFMAGLAEQKDKLVLNIPSQNLSLVVKVLPQKIKNKFKRRRGNLLSVVGTVYPKAGQFVFD